MIGRFRPPDYRLLIVVAVAGLLLGTRTLTLSMSSEVAPARDGEAVSDAVKRNMAALLLAHRGARVLDPREDVAAIGDPPPGGLGGAFSRRVFVALAVPPGGRSRDLYRLEARVAPNGAAFDPAWIVNLTQSLHADDGALAVSGARVATAASWAGRVAAIEVRDLAGEDPLVSGVDDWGFWQRMGDRVTNLERTGQAGGVALEHFTLEGASPPAAVRLSFGDGALDVRGFDARAADPGPVLARIDLSTCEVAGTLVLSRLPVERKMPMEPLNWLADRGRGFAEQGLAPMWLGASVELLKELYFEAKQAGAAIEDMAYDPDEADTVASTPLHRAAAREAFEEAVELARVQAEKGSFAWPPPPIAPMLDDERRPGEGIWEPIGPDRVEQQPNAPPLFYQTFLHPASRYRQKRLHIVAWDPARLSLGMRAGTREPVPMTAHRGDGRIPRDPEHLRRVVAAFNGGFQTTHIWYGMMVDRKVLLPTRALGATIALMADGRTAMGTWKQGAPVPPDMVSYRQNLPPLVQDGVFNPYRRARWGGHVNVAGAKDGWTVRSAVCTIPPGYMLYIYAEYADQHTLADALLHMGCSYGVHLDMNFGHTGFELYRHLAEGQEPSDPEAYVEAAGVRFEGAVPHSKIRHMSRPRRYLRVDYRDFFYLYARPAVPGTDLAPIIEGEPAPGDGSWRVSELPMNAVLPPRMAWTTLRATRGHIEVLQVDTSAARIRTTGPADADGRVPAAEFHRESLVASIPIAEVAGTGVALLDVDGVTLRGRSPDADDGAGPTRGTLVGLDRDGLMWVARLHGAPLGDARGVLLRRGVAQPLWFRTPDDDPVWMYQPANNAEGKPALLELLPGDTQGAVVARPTARGPRLLVHASERPERVIRLFPELTSESGPALKASRDPQKRTPAPDRQVPDRPVPDRPVPDRPVPN